MCVSHWFPDETEATGPGCALRTTASVPRLLRVTGRDRPVRATEEERRLGEVRPLVQGHEPEKRRQGVLVRASCWCPQP